MIDYRMKELSQIINDLNILTGIKCVLYDEKFEPIYHYEKVRCGFCTLLRENAEYAERCLCSDREGLEKCTETGAPHAYKCHMGLSEILTPIISGDITIGYILVGQSVCGEDMDRVKKNVEKYPDKDKISRLLSELERVKKLSGEELSAMARLVGICTSYINIKKLIKQREEPTRKLLDEYIRENIRYKIGIENLSRAFGMSRSSLYSFSVKHFGMGITEYINKIRLEAARDLLLSTDMSVSEISYAVGILDTNYFVKKFRAKFGMSPRKWKNNQK